MTPISSSRRDQIQQHQAFEFDGPAQNPKPVANPPSSSSLQSSGGGCSSTVSGWVKSVVSAVYNCFARIFSCLLCRKDPSQLGKPSIYVNSLDDNIDAEFVKEIAETLPENSAEGEAPLASKEKIKCAQDHFRMITSDSGKMAALEVVFNRRCISNDVFRDGFFNLLPNSLKNTLKTYIYQANGDNKDNYNGSPRSYLGEYVVANDPRSPLMQQAIARLKDECTAKKTKT